MAEKDFKGMTYQQILQYLHKEAKMDYRDAQRKASDIYQSLNEIDPEKPKEAQEIPEETRRRFDEYFGKNRGHRGFLNAMRLYLRGRKVDIKYGPKKGPNTQVFLIVDNQFRFPEKGYYRYVDPKRR